MASSRIRSRPIVSKQHWQSSTVEDLSTKNSIVSLQSLFYQCSTTINLLSEGWTMGLPEDVASLHSLTPPNNNNNNNKLCSFWAQFLVELRVSKQTLLNLWLCWSRNVWCWVQACKLSLKPCLISPLYSNWYVYVHSLSSVLFKKLITIFVN
jgi:hypothetical protein